MKQRLLSGLAAVALAGTGLVVTATPALANTCTTPYLMGTGPEMGTVTTTEAVAAGLSPVDWWEHETALVNRTVTLAPTDPSAATLTVYAADCTTVLCATANGPTTCASPIPAGKIRIKVEYSPLGGTSSTGYSLTATGMTPTECNDGIDNDGDGWADFGTDPHCYGVADNTESQLIVAAYGHITITASGNSPPTYVTTGVYNDPSKYHCDMNFSPYVEVVCTEYFNTEIAHDCAAFILTATAPAPGVTGTGNVAGYVGCASGSIETADVTGTGTAQNSAGSATLGRADPVVCRALGINNAALPSGTYQVDCYEPGVAWPLDRR